MFRFLTALYFMLWIQAVGLVFTGSRVTRLLMTGPVLLVPVTLYFFWHQELLSSIILSACVLGLFVSCFDWKAILLTVIGRHANSKEITARIVSILLLSSLITTTLATVLIILVRYEGLEALVN